MSTLPFPWNQVNLTGYSTLRIVVLTRPELEVVQMLPAGLQLARQRITPTGTHPVVLLFNILVGAQVTLPTPLPLLNYHEAIVAVPYVDVIDFWPRCGPFLYLPRLWVDNQLVVVGARSFWGYAKDLARIEDDGFTYRVSTPAGVPVCRFEREVVGRTAPLRDYPNVEQVREMIDLPNVMQQPLGIGPLWVGADWEKDWNNAEIEPLTTVVHIEPGFVDGLPRRRYPREGHGEGIDTYRLGAFEARVRFSLSIPYPIQLHPAVPV